MGVRYFIKGTLILYDFPFVKLQNKENILYYASVYKNKVLLILYDFRVLKLQNKGSLLYMQFFSVFEPTWE